MFRNMKMYGGGEEYMEVQEETADILNNPEKSFLIILCNIKLIVIIILIWNKNIYAQERVTVCITTFGNIF